jgi:hypothetical protein
VQEPDSFSQRLIDLLKLINARLQASDFGFMLLRFGSAPWPRVSPAESSHNYLLAESDAGRGRRQTPPSATASTGDT